MKMNIGKGSVSINTKGEGEHIEEFILFLANKENGIGVVRVLGEDMTPQNVMTIVGLLQKADVDQGALKPLMNIMKEK
jgi:predicted RNA-binding protein